MGYKAIDFRFIDNIELLSHTKVEQVKSIYIADTFGVQGNQVQYNHPELAGYFENKNMNILWAKKYTNTIAIGIIEIQERK